MFAAMLLVGCRDACAQRPPDGGRRDASTDAPRSDRSSVSDVSSDATRGVDAGTDAGIFDTAVSDIAMSDIAASDAGPLDAGVPDVGAGDVARAAAACPVLEGGPAVYAQVFRSRDDARLTPQSTPGLTVVTT